MKTSFLLSLLRNKSRFDKTHHHLQIMLARPGLSSGAAAAATSCCYSTRVKPDLRQFVPVSADPTDDQVADLTDFVRGCRDRLLVVTGAGISTESGLPDYRSEGVGLYAKKDHKVTQHQTFVKSEKARKSYWVR